MRVRRFSRSTVLALVVLAALGTLLNLAAPTVFCDSQLMLGSSMVVLARQQVEVQEQQLRRILDTLPIPEGRPGGTGSNPIPTVASRLSRPVARPWSVPA